MIAAVDVDYRADVANIAAVVFENWEDAAPLVCYRHRALIDADYLPGKFYLRELGPIESVLGQVCQTLGYVVVDGYVAFGPGRPGLGQKLYDRMGGRVAVIGVAKRLFKTASYGEAITRGNSMRPLYITAAGLTEQRAAQLIAGMHGTHRIPTMLKAVDRMSKAITS